ncbi:MAG: POTRA domain-containing protein, partial [Microcystaceae cyanobacterium]
MQKTLRYCFGLVGTVSFLINPASAQQLSFPSSSPPNQASQTQSAQLTVKEIIIVGSTALSSPELEAIKAPYIGKTGTLQEIQADIQAMVQAINDLYLSQGYIASGAFFPPQDLSEGTVRIQVVEGKLEKLEILGLSRLQESYVRERLLLAASPVLNLQRLQEALQLLQINPLFQSVQAELKAGTSPELRILAVQVE